MIKLFFSFIIAILFIVTSYAQSPQAFQYQAIARDNSGTPLNNQNISIRISVISGSAQGTLLYTETHNPSTNQFGLFTLEVGTGVVNTGMFNTISWGSNIHYLQVEMDAAGGTIYQLMGTVQLISVPYALHANSVDNADDADADPNNEIQTLSLNGQDLTISNGNTVTLPADTVQTLSLNGQDLTISNGNTVTLPADTVQTLSLNGQDLTISNGNTVTLPADTVQTLSLNGQDLTISNGNTVTLPADTAQTLSLNGQDLTISNGNTVTLPGGGGTLDDAYDFGGSGAGRIITIDAGEIDLTTNTVSGIAIRTTNTNTGAGVVSNNTNASNSFSAIQANTNSTTSGSAAIIGNTTGSAWGVAGQVASTATAEAGLYGSNLRTNGGHGIYGVGFNGVVGQTGQSTGYAVYGENLDNITPWGNGVGVAGKGYYGVLGEDRYLGAAAGAYGLYSNGALGATGTKTFRIDHPQDPENKYLRHFSIESDEVLNVYRGTATFDVSGDAIISLPSYFNEININISYQITPIGAHMPLFVKEKVNANNQFTISGGISGKEVSWAVYAERNDLYMQKHPDQKTVELEKRPQEKGKYLIPSLYGASNDKAIFGTTHSRTDHKEMNILK
ncbi:MAG: hypothetical protein MK207_04350 [Saprospiraceae bacterium]|nr:hypothetical protein [Saprospiraceae bacterium]